MTDVLRSDHHRDGAPLRSCWLATAREGPAQTVVAACAALLVASILGCASPVLVKPGAPPDVAARERAMCAEHAGRDADFEIRRLQGRPWVVSSARYQGEVNLNLMYQEIRFNSFVACLKGLGWVEREASQDQGARGRWELAPEALAVWLADPASPWARLRSARP